MHGARMGPGAEFDLIRRFLPRAPDRVPGVVVGPGDDAALVTGEGIALSADLSLEGTHFRRDWLSPAEIGYRAATAALSDLAAVAARPIGVLVSLGVPAGDGDFAAGIMDGVRNAAARVGGAVLGGDLARSTGPVVIDVVVVGETRSPVLRVGAAPGDELWVTGRLGAAALAVAQLLRGESPDPGARERFARPAARAAEALWLKSRSLPTAMLDLSDGLAGDAAHLAAASGVAVVLDLECIPLHPALDATPAGRADALALALSGGEDYELCFSAAAGAGQRLADEFRREHGVELTRVGVVERGEGVYRRAAAGGRVPLGAGGFQHFGGGA